MKRRRVTGLHRRLICTACLARLYQSMASIGNLLIKAKSARYNTSSRCADWLQLPSPSVSAPRRDRHFPCQKCA